nr:hypothetical protein [Nanoarchaeum sp.]
MNTKLIVGVALVLFIFIAANIIMIGELDVFNQVVVENNQINKPKNDSKENVTITKPIPDNQPVVVKPKPTPKPPVVTRAS